MLIVILVALVALEHLYIMILEMFFWTSQRTLKLFGLEPSLAEKTKAMAANQGLYNGFLSAGLAWSLLPASANYRFELQVFFLSCVIVAAIFGAFTIKPKILILQGIPAMVALALVLLA